MSKKPSNSKRPRRTFSDEYKIEAVKMVTEQGYKVTDAAKQLGINPNQIHQWKEKFSEQEESSDNEELNRLRAEVKRLRMERDILKKTTAFFANEKN
jgi:transposase